MRERVNLLSDMYDEKLNPRSEDAASRRGEIADKSSQISLKIAEDTPSTCQEMQQTFDELIFISYCFHVNTFLDHVRFFWSSLSIIHQCIYSVFTDNETALKCLQADNKKKKKAISKHLCVIIFIHMSIKVNCQTLSSLSS